MAGNGDRYVECNMHTGAVVWPVFNSLQAFWPGMQVLVGDVAKATRTHRAFFEVWQRYGFTPEGFHLLQNNIHGERLRLGQGSEGEECVR